MKQILWTTMGVATALAGCTTLGPTPLSTGFSARPAGGPDLAIQAGAVPGYFLSKTTTDDPAAAPIGQIGALFEPGASVPGLVIGARVMNPEDAQAEPVIGYRKSFGPDKAVALAGFVGGTFAHGEENGAEYDVKRVSGEFAIDARIARLSSDFSIMGAGTLGVSYSSVQGSYCTNTAGYGVDCPDATGANASADLGILTPSLTAGLALDFDTRLHRAFHGARLAANVGVVRLPGITEQGGQADIDTHKFSVTAGLMLTVRVGGTSARTE